MAINAFRAIILLQEAVQKRAISAKRECRAILNNYSFLRYFFKSNTLQHFFLIYNSQRLFNVEKSDFMMVVADSITD